MNSAVECLDHDATVDRPAIHNFLSAFLLSRQVEEVVAELSKVFTQIEASVSQVRLFLENSVPDLVPTELDEDLSGWAIGALPTSAVETVDVTRGQRRREFQLGVEGGQGRRQTVLVGVFWDPTQAQGVAPGVLLQIVTLFAQAKAFFLESRAAM